MRRVCSSEANATAYLKAAMNHFGGESLHDLELMILASRNEGEEQALRMLVEMKQAGVQFAPVESAKPYLVYEPTSEVNITAYANKLNELVSDKEGDATFFLPWRIAEVAGREYFVRVREDVLKPRKAYSEFSKRAARWARETALPLIIYARRSGLLLGRRGVLRVESDLNKIGGPVSFKKLSSLLKSA